jgi:isopenicillin N synthase-like dioxygenase
LNLALPVDLAAWPARPVGLTAACRSYIQALTDLAATLMAIFAQALDLPIDYFGPKIDQARTVLRLLNYPPVSAAKPGQMRAAAHTDYGTLTILWSEDSRGLQARNRQGGWVDVAAAPDAFIINIGDLMMNWTNDRWISTLHRVIPLPGCCDDAHPPKYAPIPARDHLNRKIAKALGEAS